MAQKPRLGLALGGGGAKGFSHIGVLKTFQDAGIEFDVVAGTSVGALVGAIYLEGQIEKLEQEASRIKITDIPFLLSPAWSIQGIFSGKNALERLSDYVRVQRIEELSKPYAAVSVDLRSGSTVIFTEGDIRVAIRASISVPMVFTPVVMADAVLVDGGTLEPVPVCVARSLGADIVVAVDLFGNSEVRTQTEKSIFDEPEVWPKSVATALHYFKSVSEKVPLPAWFEEKYGKRGFISNVVEVIERTLAVSQKELTMLRLAAHPADLLIQPAVSGIGLLDFHRGQTGIELGKEAALTALPKLQKLLRDY